MNSLRNILLVVITVILWLVFGFIIANKMNENNSFENKLEAMMPKDKDNFDFSQTIFNITKMIDSDADAEWCKRELASLTHELRLSLGDEGNPEEKVKIINNFMFKEKGFGYSERAKEYFAGKIPDNQLSNEEYRDFFTISALLKTRKGVCLNLSILYLMLAEQLKLPIYGSILPGHIFVRYIEDGRSRINIDPAGSGLEYYHYDDSFKIDLDDKNDSIYGQKVGNYNVVGAYLYNLAIICERMCKRGKAEILFKKAAEINPNDANTHYALAEYLFNDKKYSDAERQYRESIRLYPNNSNAHSALAVACFLQAEYYDAEKEINEALRLNPNNEYAKQWLEKIQKLRKQ